MRTLNHLIPLTGLRGQEVQPDVRQYTSLTSRLSAVCDCRGAVYHCHNRQSYIINYHGHSNMQAKHNFKIFFHCFKYQHCQEVGAYAGKT